MTEITRALLARLPRRSDEGAVGMLILGVIIGVLLVIFGIVKLLIPGD